MARLTVQEVTLMKRVDEGASLAEVAEELNCSVTWVWKMANALQEQSLIVQVRPHGARSRKLTEYGRTELQRQGLLPVRAFTE